MLPVGVFKDGDETGEDNEEGSLPCMVQTAPSTCGDKEGELIRSMPSIEPGKRAYGCLVMECLEDLLDTFTGKEIKALAHKASKLQSDDAIRKGFDDDTYFVKSTSTCQPHMVKRVTGSRDGAGSSCDRVPWICFTQNMCALRGCGSLQQQLKAVCFLVQEHQTQSRPSHGIDNIFR